jgi:hypothetical protein
LFFSTATLPFSVIRGRTIASSARVDGAAITAGAEVLATFLAFTAFSFTGAAAFFLKLKSDMAVI